jgi:glycerol-3-phosphate acyltransferase PlsX
LNRAYDAARHQLLGRVAARIAHAAPLLNAQGLAESSANPSASE